MTTNEATTPKPFVLSLSKDASQDDASIKEISKRPGIIVRFALALLRAYQHSISPSLGNVCRFQPTCSHYAYDAIERYGVGRGIVLAIRRLLRCRPFGGGGYDPVP